MNCIIVDDEPLAREGLQSMIEEIADVTILGTFSNAPAAMAFLETNSIDLIFLDIQMPKVNGLEFAAKLPRQTLLIFTTAYSQYALNSYDLDAIDYILKPVDKTRLEKALKKAIAYKTLLSEDTDKTTIEKEADGFLLIKADRRYYKITPDDIRFVEGLKDYVVIHTKVQKLITAMNLKTFHQKLSTEKFLRVSKSYIVNLGAVDSFDTHNIYISEHEIPLGENYKPEFIQRYLGDCNE